MQTQKGVASVILVVVIVVLLVVAGFFAYQYFSPKPNSQPQVQNQQQNNNQTADQTTGWKTYTNTQYGFEIKYPSDWIVNNDPSYDPIIKFCGPEYKTVRDCGFAGKGGTASISFRNDSLDITTTNFCAENPDNIFCGKNVVKSNIEIDGRSAFIVEFKDLNGGAIFALWKQRAQDNKMLELEVSGLKSASEYRDVFDKMLSTFKFTK